MTCAHSGCTCGDATVVVEGQSYCSDACAHDAKAGAGARCNCGHPGCRASVARTATPNPTGRPKPPAPRERRDR